MLVIHDSSRAINSFLIKSLSIDYWGHSYNQFDLVYNSAKYLATFVAEFEFLYALSCATIYTYVISDKQPLYLIVTPSSMCMISSESIHEQE
ncbi:hypothetical protein AYI69_g8116 [Smittium culicis]|uniref:Uncharacterized protein n=1 Tax=Smittium culicis TaxID=133412 RepID=A0A1R1XM18_9FUNG|nr:hypothetical protein AYI69_g8116 [Smittium culicis]